jgi:hypothetical protein
MKSTFSLNFSSEMDVADLEVLGRTQMEILRLMHAFVTGQSAPRGSLVTFPGGKEETTTETELEQPK